MRKKTATAEIPSDSEGLEPSVKTNKLIERKRVENERIRELLSDLNFSRGFSATPFHSNNSNGRVVGRLNYNGIKADGAPVWRLAQWGCTKNIVSRGDFFHVGNIVSYDDGGKFLSVDTSRAGCISLCIRGSEEYAPDAQGDVRERIDPTENWPHILIEQQVDRTITGYARALFMEIEYTVSKCISLVNRQDYPFNKELNTAQFQWFIRLIDNDKNSASFGQSMWFGFSMFDARQIGDTPKGWSACDGGKEDSTGLFIYMPCLKDVGILSPNSLIDSVPTSVIGKRVRIRLDILPLLEQALQEAKRHGAMSGASPTRLKIGDTNIGWEIPGNYDVSVRIDGMNMYEVF